MCITAFSFKAPRFKPLAAEVEVVVVVVDVLDVVVVLEVLDLSMVVTVLKKLVVLFLKFDEMVFVMVLSFPTML